MGIDAVDRSSLEKHFTASAFVLNPYREVLLIHHRKLDVWLYPGGHIDAGETPDDAVRREVREETGLGVDFISECDTSLADTVADVQALHRPYRVLCEFIDSRHSPHYHIDLIYLCSTHARVLPDQREISNAGFFNQSGLVGLRMFPNFRRMLDHVFDDETVWRAVLEQQAQ